MAHDQMRMDDVCSNTSRFYDRAISPGYNRTLGLNLSESAKRELIEYFESLQPTCPERAGGESKGA